MGPSDRQAGLLRRSVSRSAGHRKMVLTLTVSRSYTLTWGSSLFSVEWLGLSLTPRFSGVWTLAKVMGAWLAFS